jgi:hypothetical protein
VYLLSGYLGSIYRTSDNAKTWTLVADGAAGRFGFFDDKIGYSGGNFASYIQGTTNGGISWTRQYVKETVFSEWRRISAPSELTAYALANDTMLYKTTDGGVGSQNVVVSNFVEKPSLHVRSLHDVLHVEYAASTISRTLELSDVNGRIIKKIMVSAGNSNSEIDIHNVLPSVYFIRLGGEVAKVLRFP